MRCEKYINSIKVKRPWEGGRGDEKLKQRKQHMQRSHDRKGV
jgi:hypothetical protein